MQPPQPSEQNLVTLYDDFTQLQSLCSFLCDTAVALHIADIELIDAA